MKYKVIRSFRPMYNPSAWFDWDPVYYEWKIVAWAMAFWFAITHPQVTDVAVYRRVR